MPLKSVKIPMKSLGERIEFIKHVETIGRTVRRGRMTTTVPEQEVYELMSAEHGSFTVTVPTSGGLEGDFYKKTIKLDTPKIVISPITAVNRGTGEVGVRPRMVLEAEKIELGE
ncbi:hypothetical protein QQG09_08240 [Melissococcus plutonius]|nr:hypothetical protein [Melissococcus plutonius]KMT26977.1 hypothetical protein MEPL4_8c00120 [Melissococcus plutonius]KMT29110.1 hypothetical protein MEPL7_19p00180 [Melissococcus plutonius]KMT33560.1 hypothetical protein MEPL9_11c00130 [Melissococcus plutonius]KMT37176.1 hypothetical protein MEPL11_13c00010 [Melissococcus plutonius]MCV2499625.1 hypothetical protein [Melissococcus plutonius]